jgi:uncharacterized protein YegL
MKKVLMLVLLLATAHTGYGQGGVSSASVSRARTESGSSPGATVTRTGRPDEVIRVPEAPDPIAVEEIINYHRHRLPLPRSGIALDVRWGNGDGPVEPSSRGISFEEDADFTRVAFAYPGTPAILQIGLATAEFSSTTKLRPLNLALVIDHSGSMAAADKMNQVKSALRTLIGRLQPTDIVSIIVFDDSAEVVMPASPVRTGREHLRVIDRIQPAGATNINSGLMLGYDEALRHFSRERTNRVILLTDGIANTGEVNPVRIASNSQKYNERGIDLSTIGVGRELDNDLLRTLAKRGRGLYHFVADGRDVEKIFVDEIQSLLSPVARDVRVEITAGPGLHLEQLYGYEPHRVGGNISLDLDDMNNGATQVILLRYAAASKGQVTVRLRYFDIERQRNVEDVRTVALRGSADALRDLEVRKNFSIATIAQGLSDMQKSWERRDYVAAENVLHAAVRETRTLNPIVGDSDVRAQLEVAENYLRTLATINRRFD